MERMRREGLHTDVRSVFAATTLAALASAVGGDGQSVEVPANRIPPECEAITPEMVTADRTESEEIERIVSRVPGGARNVQDIYPLAPLQEGILFHHLLEKEGDPYLSTSLMMFETHERLPKVRARPERVIERHDDIAHGGAVGGALATGPSGCVAQGGASFRTADGSSQVLAMSWSVCVGIAIHGTIGSM